MRAPPRPQPLTGSAGLWVISKPGFTQLANSTLGDAGTPADGFDNSAAGVLSALSASDSLINAITKAGDVLSGSTAALDAIKMGDIDQAISAAQAASSPMLGKIAAAAGGVGKGLPAPVPLGQPPNPPVIASGCGGGSAGGGAAGLGQQASFASTVGTDAGNYMQGLIDSGQLTGALAQGVATALPIIGAVIGIGLILVKYLGHGCGDACIDAAKAEQIYEAAADDIVAVFKLGMITQAQTLAILIHLLAAGSNHMQGFGTSQANKGSQNMQKQINALIAGIPHTAQPKATPLNLTTAHEHYISGPGWYPDSIAAAGPLADEYLQALSAT